jgi:hypothetical protein
VAKPLNFRFDKTDAVDCAEKETRESPIKEMSTLFGEPRSIQPPYTGYDSSLEKIDSISNNFN